MKCYLSALRQMYNSLNFYGSLIHKLPVNYPKSFNVYNIFNFIYCDT